MFHYKETCSVCVYKKCNLPESHKIVLYILKIEYYGDFNNCINHGILRKQSLGRGGPTFILCRYWMDTFHFYV